MNASGKTAVVAGVGPGLGAALVRKFAHEGFVIVAVLFAMIYKYLPDARIDWKDVWIGAAVTAALFTAGKYVIGVYIGQTAMASAFGAAGSFAVLLIWVYYSALICFFGAEFTQVYSRRHGAAIRPEEHATRAGKKSDELPAA